MKSCIFVEKYQQFVGICLVAYNTVTFTCQTRRRQNQEGSNPLFRWIFLSDRQQQLSLSLSLSLCLSQGSATLGMCLTQRFINL